MNFISKSTILFVLAGTFTFLFQSCTNEERYEEPLSLTTEEFEATVIGTWKCVCAGSSVSMDENEEKHISENYKIPIELDYVDITSDAATFYFKSSIPLIISNGSTYSDTSSINQLTYLRSENWLLGEYSFQENFETGNCYLSGHPILAGKHTCPGNIDPYGKKDKHADRLIIHLSDFVYFECERK